MKIKNEFKVPSKQWKRWSEKAKKTFNEIYSFGVGDPSTMAHPNMPKIKPFYFKTIAWNFAWLAADAVDDSIPEKVITVKK